MAKRTTTLVILLDAFRGGENGYLHKEDTPFLWNLSREGLYVKSIHNPGGYCERSVFMTGAPPELTGNYFAMSLMPVGYKRAPWEPTFNVPKHIRDRLCMTEDVKVDYDNKAFYNPDTDKVIESFWDIMLEDGKGFAFEGCAALGIRSYQGKTTHGTRFIQLADQIEENHELYYLQVSETDQMMHYRGTDREARKDVLRWVDSQVEWLVGKFNEHFDQVNLVIFGDHGMSDVKARVDLALEYPPYVVGWDYLYLKSSAAIQFWVFNKEVEKWITSDQKLLKYGEFVESPSKRQGDLIWRATRSVLVSPCHFHGRNDPIVAMHGWDEDWGDMKGMAIISPGDGVRESGSLYDICNTICDLVGIRYPKYSEGSSYAVHKHS